VKDFKYSYCLGHQPIVGCAEIVTTYGVHQNDFQLSNNGHFLYADTQFDIRPLGSVRYVSECIYRGSEAAVLDSLQQYIVQNSPVKKVGVITSQNNQKPIIKLLKPGVKSLTFIDSEGKFTYGHWKATKQWYVIRDSKEIWKIIDVFDQQFWAELDTSLPHSDMSRGIINLKLARTLGSFSEATTVWDPFCGFGRVVVANLDRGQKWYASDIDDLTKEVSGNLNKARYLFGIDKVSVSEVPNEHIFVSDAEKFNNLPEDLKTSGLAVVTEGFLGKNFTSFPNKKEIIEQLTFLELLWGKVLRNSRELGINELVFCLPFYNVPKKIDMSDEDGLYIVKNNLVIPTFYVDLALKNSYSVENLSKMPYLLYTRPQSFVGHCIVKLSAIVR
jgi:hypothetical protein